jgi:hypothetical protein
VGDTILDVGRDILEVRVTGPVENPPILFKLFSPGSLNPPMSPEKPRRWEEAPPRDVTSSKGVGEVEVKAAGETD